jgi:microcystin degradation protein MlrC
MTDEQIAEMIFVVRQVCYRRFPHCDYREFVGFVWECLARQKARPEKLFRWVRSRMLDCLDQMNGRSKLVVQFVASVPEFHRRPSYYALDGRCENQRISARVAKHKRARA